MDLASLELLLRSENRSRGFLVSKCWGKQRRFCIRCRRTKLYRLAENRYRCAACRYTFQDFSGRWIGQLNLRARQWLRILKLFELEIPPSISAREVGISYPTALKATQLIRCAILQQTGDFAQFSHHIGLFSAQKSKKTRGKEPTGDRPVFGISESGGRVRISVINDLSAQALLREPIKTVKRGALAYTDRFRNYDAIIFYGTRRLTMRFARRFGRGKVYINGLNGFWRFVKKRLTEFHAVSKQSFPLYVKEMEFRYNHRHVQLFEALAHAAAQLVPNPLVAKKK